MSLPIFNDGESGLAIQTKINDGIKAINNMSWFERYADTGNNTGTGETDIFNGTIPGGNAPGLPFFANGDKLIAEFGGTIVFHATATRRIKFKFDGQTYFDTTAFTVAQNTSWKLKVTLIRVDPNTVRYMIEFHCFSAVNGGAADISTLVEVGEWAGPPPVDFNTPTLIQVTGEAVGAGAANDDIVLMVADGSFRIASDGTI